MMSVATLDDLLDVLANRRKHCRDLLDLSRRQNRVIDSGDYPQLMTILAQKQRILGRLDEIQRRFPDLGHRWSVLRATGPTPLRRDCEAIIAETEAVLAELLKNENEGAEQLSRRREITRRQLEGISEGVRVNESYCEALAPVNHRFLDINR